MSYLFQHIGGDFPNKGRNVYAGGWKELGRTTLGADGDLISVTSLADKRYYMILCDKKTGTATDFNIRYNNDSGISYASRYSDNGGADGTQLNSTYTIHTASGTPPEFVVGNISNYSTKEKLSISHSCSQNTAGATNIPNRRDAVGKWVNTTDVINRIDIVNVGAGDYATGSELVVLGWDPLDNTSSNFWEELASVNAGGASTNLSSGTITAKKYLWVQAWLKNTTSHTTGMTFNNDTTTYASRYSDNGGADSTAASQGDISLYSAVTTPIFVNMFIINNSANEKLVIGHTNSQSTAGAGTACNRREFIAKYDSTAAQITEIDIDSSAGNWDSTSIIKVWGSD